jgi:hypothetical protein
LPTPIYGAVVVTTGGAVWVGVSGSVINAESVELGAVGLADGSGISGPDGDTVDPVA